MWRYLPTKNTLGHKSLMSLMYSHLWCHKWLYDMFIRKAYSEETGSIGLYNFVWILSNIQEGQTFFFPHRNRLNSDLQAHPEFEPRLNQRRLLLSWITCTDDVLHDYGCAKGGQKKKQTCRAALVADSALSGMVVWLFKSVRENQIFFNIASDLSKSFRTIS